MENNTVYEFTYNSCIYDGSDFTVSIHRTKKGAEKALKAHKEEVRQRYLTLLGDDEGYELDKDWDIVETEILE